MLLARELLVGLIALGILPHLYIKFRLIRDQVDVEFTNTPRTRLGNYYQQLLSSVRFAKEIRLYRLGQYILDRLLANTSSIHQEQRSLAQRQLKWDIALTGLAELLAAIAFIIVMFRLFRTLCRIRIVKHLLA